MVRLWDAQTGQELQTLAGQARPGFLSFSPDGYRLACSGSGDSIYIYDATPLPEKP